MPDRDAPAELDRFRGYLLLLARTRRGHRLRGKRDPSAAGQPPSPGCCTVGWHSCASCWRGPTPMTEADDQLGAVLAEYLEAVDAGGAPDREALIARHPDLADALRAYFSDQDRLDALA